MTELSENLNSTIILKNIEPLSNQNNIFDLISQLNDVNINEPAESRPVSKIPRFGNLLKQEQIKKKL